MKFITRLLSCCFETPASPQNTGKMPSYTLGLESLEARVAPANFLFATATFGVSTSGGANASDAATAMTAGSDLALKLNAGDTLYFDSNGNGAIDLASDAKLINVTTGKAIAFFDDLNMNTKGDLYELTGFLVGDKFKGSVNTDVNGPVATLVDASGSLTTTAMTGNLQKASIDDLTVKGHIVGGIYAGGNINKLSVGSVMTSYGLGSYDSLSAWEIRTGNAAGGAGVNLGNTFTLAFAAQPDGSAGASISNVTLARGLLQTTGMFATGDGIVAGDGVDNPAGVGGAGGSVSNVTIGGAGKGFDVKAGKGGEGTGGAGGAGGSLSNIKISFYDFNTGTTPDATTLNSPIKLLAGTGGDSTSIGDGGAGGAISGSQILVNGDALGLYATAGAGGAAMGTGSGGAGGSITKSTFLAGGALGYDNSDAMIEITGGFLSVKSGVGGFSVEGTGGAGGLISETSVHATGGGKEIQEIEVRTGNGGDSTNGVGGSGGTISKLNVLSLANVGILDATTSIGYGNVRIIAGFGQSAPKGGGDGGSVINTTVQIPGGMDGKDEDFQVYAGNAGAASSATVSKVGNGGSITGLTLRAGLIENDIDTRILTGTGGSAGASKLNGGNGGSATNVVVDIQQITPGAFMENWLWVTAAGGGSGGSNTSGNAKGGAGGSISNLALSVAHDAVEADVRIQSGSGGTGVVGGAGGSGGALSNIKAVFGGTIDTFTARSGSGGAGGNGPIGGTIGGSISGLTVAAGDVTGTVNIYAGTGGSNGTNGPGGAGGSISKTDLKFGDVGTFVLTGGNGGFTGANGNGGAGGSLSDIKLALGTASVASVTVSAGNGSAGGTTTGTGGAGGSIKNLTLASGGTTMAGADVSIGAGTGGNGADGGGAGGAISGLKGTLTGSVADRVQVSAGTGGNATVGGKGGAGGNLTASTVTTATVGGSLSVLAGNGGDTKNAAAPKGGNIDGVTVTNLGTVAVSGSTPAISIVAGAGGAVSSGNGAGGAGGNLNNTKFSNRGGVFGGDRVELKGGKGGSGFGTGNGGNSGNVAKVTLENLGTLIDTVSVSIGSDQPGNGGMTLGNGGAGGNVSGVTVIDRSGSTAGTTGIYISAYGGGVGYGATGKGGNAGSLSNVVLDAPESSVVLGSGGSGGLGVLAGGNGGLISGIKGTVGLLSVKATGGGNATGGTGKAGNGGSIGGIDVIATQRVQLLLGGDGGDAVLAANVGKGGSIFNIKVGGSGVIGNSKTDFEVYTMGPFSAMGGLFAGQGGKDTTENKIRGLKNGTISGVTATQITAIMAGVPEANTITSDNAVSVSGIKADLIGVDRDPTMGSAGRASDSMDADWGSFSTVIDDANDGVIDTSTLVDGIALLRVGSTLNVLTHGQGFIQTVKINT